MSNALIKQSNCVLLLIWVLSFQQECGAFGVFKSLSQLISSQKRSITTSCREIRTNYPNNNDNKIQCRNQHGIHFLSSSSVDQQVTDNSENGDNHINSNSDSNDYDVQKQIETMIIEATNVLSRFDTLQQQFIKSDGSQGMGGGTSALNFVKTQLSPNDKQSLRNAIVILTNEAHKQRSTSLNQQYGRIMLGICAENVQEGLMGLKTWVNALALPRGLLHGLDVDGKPMENPETLGSIYLKYNTGGCMTFSEMKKSGKGFDALWRPGDVVLETYDGDFRGIYYNVELEDGIFRQFGVLPTDLFLEEEEW